MQQLSPLDASFLYFETANSPMHVGGVAIYDPSTAPRPVTFEEMLENTRRRLHLAPCFRRRLVRVPFDADHPYWIEDPDFHLEHHVLHQGLPPPGSWLQLMDLCGRLMSRPLDQSRPLWELHIIEGLVDERFPEGSIAVLSKVHHCAIDGVSGIEITTALHDLAPDREIEIPADTWRPDRVPTEAELLGRSYGRAAVRGMQIADLMGRSMRSTARVGAGVVRGEVPLPTSPFTAPPTRFNRPVSPYRVIDGRIFDLEEVRAVKRTIEDATVNDVVLAICAGGLRSFLAARGELPSRPLVAMAPVSVRDASQKGTLGNQVSAMLVSLATDQPDARARLAAIHRSAVGSKTYTNAVGAKLLTDYSQFIPSATAALAARLYSQSRFSLLHPPIFNCVITNVPGPQVPLYSCGSRLVASLGAGPIFDGMGLFISIGSYCGDLVVAVTSDRNLLPDPAELCDAFVDSFAELKKAVRVVRPHRKPGRSEQPAAAG